MAEKDSRGGPGGAAAGSRAAGRYVCPMCAGVESAVAGACPRCGMALEPLDVADRREADPELTGMTRRLRLGALLTLPLLAIAMGEWVPGWGALVRGAWNPWAQAVLATPVVLLAGWPFLARGWRSVVTRQLNMFTLIALGVGAAYAYSMLAVLAPGQFPAGFRDEAGRVGLYFEAASVITVLALLGQVLELRARQRTGAALRALLDLTPKTARRLDDDGGEEDVAAALIRVGDRLRLRPGESVPVDGRVLDGRGMVDEAMVTGESTPVAKRPGDAVIGGTLNMSGGFVMRAERIGADTVLAGIVRLVADAQRSRAPIQRLADRVAGWFVPGVVGVAMLSFLGWAVLGPAPALAHALIAAVSVLIIACPCALGLATPMSIMVGMGRGARAGILIRNADALERTARLEMLVVDKTGTLTEGRPRVRRIVAAPGHDEDGVLALAAGLERASEHPLADAAVAAARERGVAPMRVRDFRSLPGRGVAGRSDGAEILLGNQPLMSEHGVDVSALASAADALRAEGATVMFAAGSGCAAGLIAVSDPIKDGAADAIAALRRDGVDIVMLTGDHRATAAAVARTLGIDDVEAEVTPEQKHAAISRLRRAGRVVAMAGDGVNDAPALAAADIGIAMGTGADVAIESADVALVGGDLGGILRAHGLSRATMRNIRQNLFFAFAYNVLGVPIAAGVLYPVLGFVLNPMIAALAMSLSSVSVIGNALRLQNSRLESEGARS